MQLDTLKRENPNKKARQVGRGGTRGKTSGRGGKGQTARAGNKRRPQMRDIIKKLPKQRGYAFNSYQKITVPISLALLEKHFESGATVSPHTLLDKKIVKRFQGVIPPVKILGKGALSKKLTISGCMVSAGAKTAVEAVGGSINS